MGGRRWYQDVPGTATTPDEHADAARMEYNLAAVKPEHRQGAHYKMYKQHTLMLRLDTQLDKPDANGYLPPAHSPMMMWEELLTTPDFAYKHSALFNRDTEGMRGATREYCARVGLPRDWVLWVFKMTHHELKRQLKERRLEKQANLCLELKEMREMLMAEMASELRYSPTQFTSPGSSSELTWEQLVKEREVNSTAPVLLVLVKNTRRPKNRMWVSQMTKIAQRLWKGARVATIDGYEFPEVLSEYKVLRFPTFLWFKDGVEVNRHVGDAPASFLYDVTEALATNKQLPPGQDHRQKLRALQAAKDKYLAVDRYVRTRKDHRSGLGSGSFSGGSNVFR
jgi:thiol-disulfide isomerase/thioredoxin